MDSLYQLHVPSLLHHPRSRSRVEELERMGVYGRFRWPLTVWTFAASENCSSSNSIAGSTLFELVSQPITISESRVSHIDWRSTKQKGRKRLISSRLPQNTTQHKNCWKNMAVSHQRLRQNPRKKVAQLKLHGVRSSRKERGWVHQRRQIFLEPIKLPANLLLHNL